MRTDLDLRFLLAIGIQEVSFRQMGANQSATGGTEGYHVLRVSSLVLT